ncbi:hypothetical protein KCP73_13200 [Salmonella enterica subsp. enterica]|nr:hypothetical protein KCP73_13200 [Salmonella enterica subsp. enterica]
MQRFSACASSRCAKGVAVRHFLRRYEVGTYTCGSLSRLHGKRGVHPPAGDKPSVAAREPLRDADDNRDSGTVATGQFDSALN